MIRGTSGSDGYGIGRAMLISEHLPEITPRTDCVPEEEMARFHAAVDKFCADSVKMADHIRECAGKDEAEIIISHICMAQDPYMTCEVEKQINGGMCAESALSTICDMIAGLFTSAEGELTRQRATDVIDIKTSLLEILLGVDPVDISKAPEGTVLVVSDLTPSMTAGIDKEKIVGIVSLAGGRTSHSTILARAMGIPMVLGVAGEEHLSDGDTVIVDGTEGIVIPLPQQQEIEAYTKKRCDFLRERSELSAFIGKKTATADGIALALYSNIGSPEDALRAMESDCEGVGLFRSEFLFLDRATLPDEEEQFRAYRKTALIMKGKPVVIRTLDVGGDKAVAFLPGMKREENPFLGFRAVRYCLKNEELFRIQLRAILRASAYGDVRILVPLVSCVDEVREVRRLISEISAELSQKHIKHKQNIQVGVMIETPAACLIADLLAREADFFSIGTNDLTQYLMAVDRGNIDVAYLYSTYNPAVLRSLQNVISCASAEGIPTEICGEAAADRRMIPLFISFGLSEFSVGTSELLAVRKAISQWSKKEADALAKKALSASTEAEVYDILTKAMK